VKRYGQRCAVARTLDVVGDRWSLLIVRELLLGPKRYSDLLEGLPGIGTNVLAGRLSDLTEGGVLARRTLPPPTPVTLYELTPAGEELRGVLAELRRWGAEHAPPSQPADIARPGWLLQTAIALGQPRLPAGAVLELHVDRDIFELRTDSSVVTVKAQPATSQPTATVKLDQETFYLLASNALSIDQAVGTADINGDPDHARELLTMLAGSAFLAG
jgi:DNA-binding HxlR family transcriptional regulator